MDQHWNALASLLLFNKSDENLDEEENEQFRKHLDSIKAHYELENNHDLKRIIQLFSDAYGTCANAVLVKLIKEHSAQPVYLYSFEHGGKFRVGDLVSTNWKAVLTSVAMRRMSLKVRAWRTPQLFV